MIHEAWYTSGMHKRASNLSAAHDEGHIKGLNEEHS